ncbi:MAG: hypothetical protein KatS3mg081_2864 [Gemmatimonadales bacterium]|nr:MAG: hypothetical protein KatS3mg081_2864 [Gemmatimonadales bacterium]
MREYTLSQLEEAALQWWRELPRGAVVWLTGDLGTGKTTLVQAFTRAANATPATSPSFALVHEYASPEGPLIHVDCYRLRRPEEALDLDLPELARRARLLFIEWPERAAPFVPEPDLHLKLFYGSSPDRRRIEGSR